MLELSDLPPAGFPREARRAALSTKFGFHCQCSKCALDGEQLTASETRLRAIGRLTAPPPTATADQILRPLQVRLRLMAQEGLPPIWAWKPALLPLLMCCMQERMQERMQEHATSTSGAWVSDAMVCVNSAVGADHASHELVAAFARMRNATPNTAAASKAERHFVEIALAQCGAGGAHPTEAADGRT